MIGVGTLGHPWQACGDGSGLPARPNRGRMTLRLAAIREMPLIDTSQIAAILADPEPTKTEIPMSRRTISWRQLAAAAAVALLGACAQMTPQQPVASNPPPVAPGPNAVWHTVYFDSNSFAIDANGQKVVNDVITALQANPGAAATIIGRTDAVGSNDYNMHLSHRRADAVRDAIIYGGKLTPERVETRWTGEGRQGVPTTDNGAAAANRVVDIAIH
jgi:outer membrane protein OmpA-like peptidoglycan-associated protein